MNDNPYKIYISDKDLKLNDQDLWLKIYEEVLDREFSIYDFDDLKDEITTQINIQKKRPICQTCEGIGNIIGSKCLGCNGKGYSY